VLDRLLDVLVVDTLRSWYQQQADLSSWWDAHHDPIVGAALALIHDSPEQGWTISTMARAIGTSRANLARRFNDLVGEPPITYLTRWRLSLAADVLCQPQSTVTSTARSVGYGSPFAFSTAFKRRYGISPQQHRTKVLATGSPVAAFSRP
jgi:AraC-like DNA-binding protein